MSFLPTRVRLTASTIASTVSSTTASPAATAPKVNPWKVRPPKRNNPKKIAKFEEKFKLLDAFNGLRNTEELEKTATVNLTIKTDLPAQLNKNAFRGGVNMPHDEFLGKKAENIVVLCDRKEIDTIKSQVNVDHVGHPDDIRNDIIEGKIKPHKLYATPTVISFVTKNIEFVKFLAKKGLVPSERRQTVVPPSEILKAVKASRDVFHWRSDDRSTIKTAIGRLSQDDTQLEANCRAILDSVYELMANHGGTPKNFRRVTLSATNTRSYSINDPVVQKNIPKEQAEKKQS